MTVTETISNPTNMRVEQWPDGSWAVVEDDPELGRCETNNYGWLAVGFPDEAEAQEWLNDYLLERQCEEWETHIRQDEDDEECPF